MFKIFKRLFDIITATLGLVLGLPLFLGIGLAIKIDSFGPIFFTQIRMGQNGQLFKIYKFRTMRHRAHLGSNQLTIQDDQRLTKIGPWLRRYKFDELPQLFNILKGEMSLVGPRPDVPAYYDLNNALHQKVLSVKPGLTCFASIYYTLGQQTEESILGRASNPEKFYRQHIFPDKMAWNARYVDQQSWWLDIKIINQTIHYLCKQIFKPQFRN